MKPTHIRFSSNDLLACATTTFRLPGMIQKIIVACATLMIVALTFAGCNQTPKNDTDAKTSGDKTAQIKLPSDSKKTTTVTPAKASVARSPAQSSNELPGVDASPAEVCQQFMKLLQSGNRLAAENLLTRTALTATSKAGLQLEPMGTPSATFDIGEARYATTEQKIAQIDCAVIDQINGDEIRTELTWMLRKQNLGWRIAGLMMQLTPDQQPDFLSFENIQDVEQIKEMATSEFTQQIDSRQADASNRASIDESSLK